MSTNDTTNSTPVEPARATTDTNKPARRERKGTFKRDATLSQLVNAVANTRRIDNTKAGKLVRSHIRGNFESYARGTNGRPKWGALKDKENKDGSRYPTMPPSVANDLLSRMSKGRG